MSEPLFLDYCATTPTDPRVVEAMLPFFSKHFGNGSQQHPTFGSNEVGAVKRARKQVRKVIGADDGFVVFTSGTTESNNLAIKGVTEAFKGKGCHVISQVTEHASVLNPLRYLESKGFEVTYLPVDSLGRVSIDELRKCLRADTTLVSIMWGNNEIGTLQEIVEIGNVCHEHGVLFHTDAAQAIGRIDVDSIRAKVDALTLSGHKIYGPKGVGAVYFGEFAKEQMPIPQLHGGGQERGLRSTTLNVPGIVGMGEACRIALSELNLAHKIGEIRDAFETELRARFDNVEFNGDIQSRLPHVSNFSIPGVDNQVLVSALSNLVVATGSACNHGGYEPSHVVRALNKQPEVSTSSLRVSFGRQSTFSEAKEAAIEICDAVEKVLV